MKLLTLDKEYTFENSEKGTNDLIEIVNETLHIENLFFSHLVIDGQEIYKEHADYILEHIEEVKEIKLEVSTVDEFVSNLLVSLNEYTRRGIPEVEKVIEEFYQKPTEDSWETLKLLLEGIGWIYQTIKTIDSTAHTISGWGEFLKSVATFDVELPNLLEALENRDATLIADIIQYEILPQFRIINAETENNFETK
ncbi:hypothetical protein ABE096_21105 [Robertmurraya massiliosenegalensis]|uniref:hypothetical protein n=1 Tax=Robertmurraya TaxID=2837507 RepID=UPI0039A512A6